MHHLTCGISSLLHSVNLILFTLLLVHLILRTSSHRPQDTEAGVACALLLALRHAAPLTLGFLHVGLLATQMHVSDSDQCPVCLVKALHTKELTTAFPSL